jgi:hypothetical protein
MIGDISIFIFKNIKQHIFCKHDYKAVHRKDLQGGFYEICRRCSKLKSNY